MKTKIKNWLMSIDDRTLMAIGDHIGNLILIGFGIVIGFLIK